MEARRWSALGLAVLTHGFRPFFLAGSVFAALGIPLWLLMLAGKIEPLGPFTALPWHVHEMLFGFIPAIMAGFVLTAIPNWTGRLPLSGLPLAALALLWLTGRIASALVAAPLVALVLDCSFLIVLSAAIWREILAGSNYRNLPVAILFSLMALANLAFHLDAGWWQSQGYGIAERAGLGVAAMLVSLIGGRIVPSFTRNWMTRNSLAPLPAPFGPFDKLVLVISAVALAGWVVVPEMMVSGFLLVVAGGLAAIRLWRWRGLRTIGEPIVAILHIGYLWLAVSFLLLGLAILEPDFVTPSAAIHALTAGAIGTMMLAVMTRASLGHTGHDVAAGPATVAIYALVTLGAVLRVAAPFLDAWYLTVLTAGGLVWSAAFALFAMVYGRLLIAPAR